MNIKVVIVGAVAALCCSCSNMPKETANYGDGLLWVGGTNICVQSTNTFIVGTTNNIVIREEKRYYICPKHERVDVFEYPVWVQNREGKTEWTGCGRCYTELIKSCLQPVEWE